MSERDALAAELGFVKSQPTPNAERVTAIETALAAFDPPAVEPQRETTEAPAVETTADDKPARRTPKETTDG